MKLAVYSQDGKKKTALEISEEVFGQEVNTGLLQLVIKSYQANKRQGTAKAKNRSDVSGGGKKPFKQKGTGRARAGSNTSPLYVRGGKAFGPVPRDYAGTIPRRMRKAALKNALAARVQEEKMLVVEKVVCEEARTKVIADMIKALPLEGVRNLMVTDGVQKEMYLSARNIKNVQIMPLKDLNALDIIKNENIILCDKELVGKLEEVVKS